MVKQKVFELTTSGKDGYTKYYVRGLKDEKEARQLAKKVFKSYYWDADGAISHYGDFPSPYGTDYSKVPTKEQFIKQMKGVYF